MSFELIKENVRRLSSFYYLDEDWDSYGACRILAENILNAICFLHDVCCQCEPLDIFISPCCDGSIHFYWTTPDGEVVTVFGGEAESEQYIVYSIDKRKEWKEKGQMKVFIDTTKELITDTTIRILKEFGTGK